MSWKAIHVSMKLSVYVVQGLKALFEPTSFIIYIQGFEARASCALAYGA